MGRAVDDRSLSARGRAAASGARPAGRLREDPAFNGSQQRVALVRQAGRQAAAQSSVHVHGSNCAPFWCFQRASRRGLNECATANDDDEETLRRRCWLSLLVSLDRLPPRRTHACARYARSVSQCPARPSLRAILCILLCDRGFRPASSVVTECWPGVLARCGATREPQRLSMLSIATYVRIISCPELGDPG